jgi:hypothetical protein
MREEIDKLLDMFLASEALLETNIQIKSSLGEGGISNHRPIILQWSFG